MKTNSFEYLQLLLEKIICNYECLIYGDLDKKRKNYCKQQIAIIRDKLKRLYNVQLTNKQIKKLVDNDTQQEQIIGFNFFGHYTRFY